MTRANTLGNLTLKTCFIENWSSNLLYNITHTYIYIHTNKQKEILRWQTSFRWPYSGLASMYTGRYTRYHRYLPPHNFIEHNAIIIIIDKDNLVRSKRIPRAIFPSWERKHETIEMIRTVKAKIIIFFFFRKQYCFLI